MPRVLVNGSDIKIGAYKFPDRKNPCLCIEKGNEIAIYATFNNDGAATKFMNKLAEFVGAKMDGKEDEE